MKLTDIITPEDFAAANAKSNMDRARKIKLAKESVANVAGFEKQVEEISRKTAAAYGLSEKERVLVFVGAQGTLSMLDFAIRFKTEGTEENETN